MAVHDKNINHQPASMDFVLVAKKREWQLVEYILPPRQTEISTVLLASSRCIGLDFPTLDSNWYSRLLSFSTSINHWTIYNPNPNLPKFNQLFSRLSSTYFPNFTETFRVILFTKKNKRTNKW